MVGSSIIPPQPSDDRQSVRLSNPDIFSDDFALEPLGLIDDPPTASPDGQSNHGHDAISSSRRQSQSSQTTIEPPVESLEQRRGSLRSNGHVSIPSRSESRVSQLSTLPRSVTPFSDSGNTASTQHRSLRTISTFGFSRAQSPYQGATGPTQPYGMYSQDVGLARNSSNATTSTIRRPERAYSGPSGPTQPYGMYPQNTVPEDDSALVAGLAPPVVAGLHGPPQNYQRRLGPDGEDADDLIGPDGYTEQLPPYSRYANGVPPKYTSGLGNVVPRNPPPVPSDESQETLTSPQSRNDAPVDPFGDSSTQLSSTASPPTPVAPKDEGGNFKERIQRKGKRKACFGISWWLCIVMIVVVFLAVLLGGVIGGLVAHKRSEQKGVTEAPAAQTVTAPPITPTSTNTQMTPPPDAVSLSSTPSNLPPLPTGSFVVGLDEPTIVTNSCLIDENQQSAWDCATGAGLIMEVQMTGPRLPMVSLSYPEPPNQAIRYGAQPPELNGLANLVLMKDKYATGRGPAYLFAQQYNKTVIVHDADIPGALPVSKRSFLKRWLLKGASEDIARLARRSDDDSPWDSDWTSNSIAHPADRPWYCYWPGTILEGFIFITQDAVQTSSASAAYLGTASATLAPSAASQTAQKRQTQGTLPTYPKVVKIEETRTPFNNIAPYCQQMQILNNNQPGPLTDPSTNQLVTVKLDENEPSVQHQFDQQEDFGQAAPSDVPANAAFPTGLPDRRRAIGKRGSPGRGPSCQCEWISR